MVRADDTPRLTGLLLLLMRRHAGEMRKPHISTHMADFKRLVPFRTVHVPGESSPEEVRRLLAGALAEWLPEAWSRATETPEDRLGHADQPTCRCRRCFVRVLLTDERLIWPRTCREYDFNTDTGLDFLKVTASQLATFMLAPAPVAVATQPDQTFSERAMPSEGEGLLAYTRAYLQRLQKHLTTVKLVGINLVEISEPYPLAESFLNLQLTANGKTEELTAPEQLLSTGMCNVVVGEPGGGKSTILQWIATRLAAAHTTLHDPVPFLIHLREHATLPELSEVGGIYTQGILLKRPEQWAESLVGSGRGVLLLDGYDEVHPEQRQFVLTWINELIAANGQRGLKIVLSTRPHAARSLIHERNFDHYHVEQMTPREIDIFVRRWWSATAPQRTRDAYVELDTLVQRILDNRVLADLARNPLLAAVLCAIYCLRSHTPSGNRVDLYSDVTEMLLRRRDMERNIEGLSLKVTRTIAQKIAIAFVEAQTSEMKQEDVFAIGRKIRSSVQGLDEIGHVDLVRQICERTYIIRSLPPHQDVDFWHNSFKEFLAACELRDEGRIAELLPANPRSMAMDAGGRDDAWAEVRYWACAILGAGPSGQIVRALIDESALAHDPYLLRRQALVSAGYAAQLEPETAEAVGAFVGDILVDKSTAIQQAWLRLGDAAIRLLRPAIAGDLGADRQATAVKLAAKVGGPLGVATLAGLPDATKAAIAPQLAALWRENLSNSEVARLVKFDSDSPVSLLLTTMDELRAAGQLGSAYVLTVSLDSRDGIETLADLPPLGRTVSRMSLEHLSVADATVLASYLGRVGHLRMRSPSASRTPPVSASVEELSLSLQDADLDVANLAALVDLKKLNVWTSGSLTGDGSLLARVTHASLIVGDLDLRSIPANVQSLAVNWPHQDLLRCPVLASVKQLTIAPGSALSSLDGIEHFPNLEVLDFSAFEDSRNFDLRPLLGATSLNSVRLPTWVDLSGMEIPEELEIEFIPVSDVFGLPEYARERAYDLIPDRLSSLDEIGAILQDDLELRGQGDPELFGYSDDMTRFERDLQKHLSNTPTPPVPGDEASVDLAIAHDRDSQSNPAYPAGTTLADVARQAWPSEEDVTALLNAITARTAGEDDASFPMLCTYMRVLRERLSHYGDIDACLAYLLRALEQASVEAWGVCLAVAAELDVRWLQIFSHRPTESPSDGL